MPPERLAYCGMSLLSIGMAGLVICVAVRYCVYHANTVRLVGAWLSILACIWNSTQVVNGLWLGQPIPGDWFPRLVNQSVLFLAMTLMLWKNPMMVIDADDAVEILRRLEEAEQKLGGAKSTGEGGGA